MGQPQVTTSGGGDIEQVAVLDLPVGDPASFAVFAHCFTGDRDSTVAHRISRALAHRGIAVLRWHVVGPGEPGADAASTSGADALVAAAGWLRDNHRAPTLLVGHCRGGAAVLAAASRLPEVTAVVTVGAPAVPSRSGGIAELDAALLVLHSPQDETVALDDARSIFQAARHPKSFVALDGADHQLSAQADSGYAADMIATWASRYLDVSDEGRPEAAETTAVDPEEVRPGVVVVSEMGEGPFSQVVRAGRHTWTADEPLTVDGGTDTGPSPYDLVLAGLGACTAMTVRMYARRKSWNLGRVTVTVSRDRVHAEDAELCLEDGDVCADGFVREVRVEGALDALQREKLAEIADKCPVHRTLERGVRVVTTVV